MRRSRRCVAKRYGQGRRQWRKAPSDRQRHGIHRHETAPARGPQRVDHHHGRRRHGRADARRRRCAGSRLRNEARGAEGHFQAAGAVGAGGAVGALRPTRVAIRAALARRRHRPRPQLRALHARAAPPLAGDVHHRHARQPRRARRRRRIWVPQHDRLRGPNVITTLTAPHSFTAERLAELRRTVPPAIAALPRPRIAVILGGKNKVYEFRDEDDARFAAALQSLGALGASFMITPSRRTHARLLEVTERGDARLSAHPVGWRGRQPVRRLPRPCRCARRHRRQRQHDGRGRRNRPPGLRVHAVGRLGQVPPLPCGARSLRRHAAAAGAL